MSVGGIAGNMSACRHIAYVYIIKQIVNKCNNGLKLRAYYDII